MNEIKVIDIDLAKSVFQVCVWMNDGSIASNRKVSWAKLLDTIRQFPAGSMIAMEAWATSQYWVQVCLISTQHVKALTHHQKNDANDALAICETAFRPGIHFVAIKTVEQQGIKALRTARQLMVEQRTALANQARSLAAEQGVEISVRFMFYSRDCPILLKIQSS